MKALRVVWAVVAVLGLLGALFAPVILLPWLAVAAVAARWLSRRENVRRGGLIGPTVALPPLVLLGLIGAAALGPGVFGWQEPMEPLGPNPPAIQWWALNPLELLVYTDPFYAGVIAPVLVVAVPFALAVTITIALGRS